MPRTQANHRRPSAPDSGSDRTGKTSPGGSRINAPPLSNIRIRLSEVSLRPSVNRATRRPACLPDTSQRPAGPLKCATGVGGASRGSDMVSRISPSRRTTTCRLVGPALATATQASGPVRKDHAARRIGRAACAGGAGGGSGVGSAGGGAGCGAAQHAGNSASNRTNVLPQRKPGNWQWRTGMWQGGYHGSPVAICCCRSIFRWLVGSTHSWPDVSPA